MPQLHLKFLDGLPLRETGLWEQFDDEPKRIVVEDAKRAKKVLDEAKLVYQETGAEQHELANKPGALAQYLEKLAAKGVNLSSIHATAVKGGKKAVVVYTVEVQAKAGEVQATAPAA